MKTDNNPVRQEFIDVAKGIGIISVVFAHLGLATRYLYLFHMPLFFFLSGMVFKPQTNQTNQTNFILSKVKSLLIPYFFFLIILYPIQVITNYNSSKIFSHELVLIVTRFFLGGEWLSGIVTVFWFITSLFATQVIYNFLVFKFSVKKVSVIISCLVLIAYINSYWFRSIRIPWNLNAVCFTIAFFHLGFMLKGKAIIDKLKLLFPLLSLLSFYLCYKLSSNTLDIKNIKYGIPVLTLCCSVTIIIFIIQLSKYLLSFKLLKNLLVYIGNSSLVIMYLHQFFNIYFKSLFNINNVFIGVASIGLCCLIFKIFSSSEKLRKYFLGQKIKHARIAHI